MSPQYHSNPEFSLPCLRTPANKVALEVTTLEVPPHALEAGAFRPPTQSLELPLGKDLVLGIWGKESGAFELMGTTFTPILYS